MNAKQKKAILDKAVELKWKQKNGILVSGYSYDLPLGRNTKLFLDIGTLEISITDPEDVVFMRKIESPEDLETLFDAICPPKFRLPFD
jgi:hypothetical protein